MTATARRPWTAVPVVVLVIGVLTLLAALRFAYSAPDAVSGGPPTCEGEVMATGAVCQETRREYVSRTGRISWYTEEEVTLTYDEKLAQQDEDAKLLSWFWGVLTGTVGLVLVFGGAALLFDGRTRRAAAYGHTAMLLLLLGATSFVGWSELRFEPGDRPGVFVWRDQDTPISAVVMLGLVIVGTVITMQSARSAEPSPTTVRGTFAGYPLAGWLERVLARLIDVVVVAIGVTILSVIISIIAFVVGRPLLGDETAALVMNVTTLVLGFLAVIVYDASIGDDKGEGATIGKRALRLRVLPAQAAAPGRSPVPIGAAYLRGLVWWAPFFVVALAVSGLGPLGPFPYVAVLLLLPLLNGAWPLVDRRLRQSLSDRLAKTVVVRNVDVETR